MELTVSAVLYLIAGLITLGIVILVYAVFKGGSQQTFQLLLGLIGVI